MTIFQELSISRFHEYFFFQKLFAMNKIKYSKQMIEINSLSFKKYFDILEEENDWLIS